MAIALIDVIGQNNLRAKLDEMLETANDAASEHYIRLYLSENNISYIKVDLSKSPYQFWHYNKFEHPALPGVKKTIADFLENHGQKGKLEQYFIDLYEKEKDKIIQRTLRSGCEPLPEDPEKHALGLLAKENRENLSLKGNSIFHRQYHEIEEPAAMKAPSVALDKK